MKLYELVDQYHRDTDLTSAEAMLRGCDEYYQLNLPDEALQMFSLMGVGMQSELSCCGAFTVAVAMIGLFTTQPGQQNTENPQGANLVRELTAYLLEFFGSLQCSQLRELQIQGFPNPCDALVPEIASKLEELLELFQFRKTQASAQEALLS